jgi:hypothetical protein
LLLLQVEHWYHRHLPDPRLLLDGDSFLPCQVAARRHHADAAHMLMPSNPITTLFADGDASLVGPPSLAAIAGAVLRATLAGDLNVVMQQQQGQEQQGQEQEEQADEQVQGSAPAAGADEEDGSCAEADRSDAAAAAGSASAVAGDEPAAPACTAAEAAPSPASSDAGDAVCGVCFDVPPQVQLRPCGHTLCTDCCQSLLAMNSRCVMVCPFCRGGVGHLQPVVAHTEHGAAGGLQAAAAVHVHVPLRPEPVVPLASVGLVA